MKKFVLLIGFLVAACGTTPEYANRIVAQSSPEMSNDPQKATVIIGVSVHNPQHQFGIPMPLRLGWLQFDPSTNKRVGEINAVMEDNCVWHSCDSVVYRTFSLPAGSYALGWALQYKAYPLANSSAMTVEYYAGNAIDVTWSGDFEISPAAARFTVTPGQVLYAGDVRFQFSDDGQISYDRTSNIEAAR